jgi:hypothetical protein
MSLLKVENFNHILQNFLSAENFREWKWAFTSPRPRAVASMYSWGWGGVGQKFPNDEKNFRIFHGIQSQEGVCYAENEDAIYK